MGSGLPLASCGYSCEEENDAYWECSAVAMLAMVQCYQAATSNAASSGCLNVGLVGVLICEANVPSYCKSENSPSD